MATKSMRYDHPAYLVPIAASNGEVGGGAVTNYNKFTAYTAMIAKSAQVTVTVAGTATTNTLTIYHVSGTATTSFATVPLSTNTLGYTTNVSLSDRAIAQGDSLYTASGPDAAGKSAVTYELLVKPGANVTA